MSAETGMGEVVVTLNRSLEKLSVSTLAMVPNMKKIFNSHPFLVVIRIQIERVELPVARSRNIFQRPQNQRHQF